VSAAAGAVGSIAAQIAAIKGATVVGIAGGESKCRHVEAQYGVSTCVDYRAADFTQHLAKACPDGIDIYFDNVGGAVRDAAWPLLNRFGRVVVCGQISQYSRTKTESGPDWYPLLTQCLSVQGFLVSNHANRYDSFRTEMSGWIRQERIVAEEYVVHGFGATPGAFIDMLSGRNQGKTIVEI
jgi:NADPH-dependent curcumin reductase CurA